MKLELIVIVCSFLLGIGAGLMVDPVRHKATQMQWALEACLNSRKHAFVLKSATKEAVVLCARVEDFGVFNLDEPFMSIHLKEKK